MSRIANYKIGEKIAKQESFINYNNTITAERFDGGLYILHHWDTHILSYNTIRNQIDYLQVGYISQTTSALIGRILRSLPRQAVLDYITEQVPSKYEKRRLSRMLWL